MGISAAERKSKLRDRALYFFPAKKVVLCNNNEWKHLHSDCSCDSLVSSSLISRLLEML